MSCPDPTAVVASCCAVLCFAASASHVPADPAAVLPEVVDTSFPTAAAVAHPPPQLSYHHRTAAAASLPPQARVTVPPGWLCCQGDYAALLRSGSKPHRNLSVMFKKHSRSLWVSFKESARHTGQNTGAKASLLLFTLIRMIRVNKGSAKTDGRRKNTPRSPFLSIIADLALFVEDFWQRGAAPSAAAVGSSCDQGEQLHGSFRAVMLSTTGLTSRLLSACGRVSGQCHQEQYNLFRL